MFMLFKYMIAFILFSRFKYSLKYKKNNKKVSVCAIKWGFLFEHFLSNLYWPLYNMYL